MTDAVHNMKRRVLTGLEWALLLTALVCFLIVGFIAWHGGSFTLLISASNPRPRLVAGCAALLGWYVLRRHNHDDPVGWKLLVGRVLLLGLSLGLSLWFAEKAWRYQLQQSQGFGTLEMFREYEEGGVIRPHSRHPVSLIITLSSNKRLIYELRPNMDKAFGDTRIVSNAAGMREGGEAEVPKPPGTVRILGIGDSGMFGWDVPQGRDYLSVLEARLAGRPAPPRYEVLNAGVPGYNTQQEVEWLAHKGLAFEPDVVVVGWCNNDFDAPFFLYQPVDYLGWEGSLLYLFVFERERFHSETKPQVDLYTSFSRDMIDPEVLNGMGVEGVERSLLRLRDLGTTHGFSILLFGAMDKKAVKLCRELEIPFYNTLDEISEDAHPGSYKVHEMHPSPEGHGVLGEHLELALARVDMLPR